MRISILGHCGSGKSTLARQIAKKYSIPHLELDRFWFQFGGNGAKSEIEKDIVREKIVEAVTNFLIQHESWVSDGVYSRVQPQIIEMADQVIFIDIPLHRRMFNHLTRVMTQKERHPETSLWQDLLFTFDMIRRTRYTNEKLPGLLAEAENKLKIVKNYREIETLLDSI